MVLPDLPKPLPIRKNKSQSTNVCTIVYFYTVVIRKAFLLAKETSTMNSERMQ